MLGFTSIVTKEYMLSRFVSLVLPPSLKVHIGFNTQGEIGVVKNGVVDKVPSRTFFFPNDFLEAQEIAIV